MHGPTTQVTESLAIYLKEIRGTDFLTSDEECDLIKSIRKGNLMALEKLVKCNLRFVVSIAKHYQHQGISLSDLISEGNLGLLKAAQRYDETRGFKFISYAVWWIRQSIMQALCEHSRIVRLPRNKINSIRSIGEAFTQLEQEFEREPSLDELAYLLNIELSDVQSMLGFRVKQVSIDAPLKEDELKSLADILKNPNAEPPDHDIANNQSLKKEVEFLLTGLKHNQAEVVRMYYGLDGEEPMTMLEISKKMKVTSERIRQIKQVALNKLKKTSRYKILQDYIRI